DRARPPAPPPSQGRRSPVIPPRTALRSPLVEQSLPGSRIICNRRDGYDEARRVHTSGAHHADARRAAAGVLSGDPSRAGGDRRRGGLRGSGGAALGPRRVARSRAGRDSAPRCPPAPPRGLTAATRSRVGPNPPETPAPPPP